jgi:hypothetical protein
LDDRNAPATTGDIADLGQKTDQFELLRADMKRGHAAVVERLSTMETRILKAFYDFAPKATRSA